MASAVQDPVSFSTLQVSSVNSSTTTTEAERSASDFIALNIASLVDKDKLSPRTSKSIRKKEPIEGNSFNGSRGSQKHQSEKEKEKEKHSIAIHVPRSDDAVAVSSRVGTPTSGKFRRLGSSRRSLASPWLDPRRVLFIFATLSSMGTMILLLLTIFTGKTIGNKAVVYE